MAFADRPDVEPGSPLSPAVSLSSPGEIDHGSIVHSLRLPVVVFAGNRPIYRNRAALRLGRWLAERYATELATVLHDHVSQIRASGAAGETLTLVRLPDGSRLFIDVSTLENGHRVVTVRAPGLELHAIAQHFRLSPRELSVVEHVIRGHSNQTIADLMKVRTDTVKKHLTSVFDKLGVDSRTQLMSLVS